MNYQTEPLTMWFDRRLIMRKSPIHNIGTFATHDIDAGELLMVVTGGILVTREVRQSGTLIVEPSLYNEETLAEDLFIITPKVFHYYLNHSCEENAIDLTRSANSTQYVATRYIHANEEITINGYDPSTLDKCNCGSPKCRWVKGEK